MPSDDTDTLSRKLSAPSGPSKGVALGLKLAGIVVTLAIASIVTWRWATARPVVITDSAMAPAVFGGEEVRLDATAYGFRLPLFGNVNDGSYPARGEVIAFKGPTDRIRIMRVVAVAGDQVQLYFDGSIDVQAKPLHRCAMGIWPKERDPNFALKDRKAFVEWNDAQPYIVLLGDSTPTGQECVDRPCRIPEGHLFVLGDNRSDSDDSRNWGFLPAEHVLGRVVETRRHHDLPAYQRCISLSE